MASIVETFAGDRRLSLVNEEIVRTFSFGEKWESLMISLRLSIAGSASLSTGVELVVGICSGNAGAFKPSSVTASFGYSIPASSHSLIYAAGPPAYFYTSGQDSIRAVNKVGSVASYTPLSISDYTIYFAASSASANPGMISFIIYKSALNTYKTYRIGVCRTVAQIQGGHTLTDFLRCAEMPLGTPASLYTNLSSVPTTANTFTTTNPMDSGFIYWNHATTPLEISDWLVIRLY